MKNFPVYNILVCLFLSLSISAQDNQDTIQRKKYFTQKIQGAAPSIDGFLDDEAWNQVEWGGGFTEQEPDNNTKAIHPTEFKILYDDKNLYVGYRCYDSNPDSIVSRMSRRDGFEGDWVEINIDSYHDLQSGYSFTSSVSGVKGDESISNQFNWDASWNPIWYLKTSIDDEGWIAEVRIPLSQLRFTDKEVQIWGIQINRRHFRDGSRSVFQNIPANASYWVRGFAELHGIKGIKPQKQLEIQPYVVGKLANEPISDVENPFSKANETSFSAGVDAKIGVTNNLILDLTINPDFGQVEADPSQLRLDGFEAFFREQRPFFIEGASIYDFQVSNFDAWGSFNRDNLFYSRRIGSSPKGYPNLADDEYFDMPDNTTILGAAKFSGRTKSGLSIGVLESITQEERAIIDLKGERREEVVEPLTSYFVGRLKQDFNNNNTTVGGSFNAVNRSLENTDLEDDLVGQAYTGGLDVLHKWKDQKWQLQGSFIFSQLLGTQETITNKQTDFLHSFDRPDADHLSVDTTATSLFGHGGSAKLASYGGKWRFSTGLTWRSPGLELNDIGFMSNADEINHSTWIGYRILKPTKIFNTGGFNYNHYWKWDFSGQTLGQSVNHNAWLQFKNFWSFNYNINKEFKDLSTRALFGGPALNRPAGMGGNIGISSDDRKKLVFSLFTNQGFGPERSVRFQGGGLDVKWQPTNAISLSVSPFYSKFERKFQYIPYLDVDDAGKYIGAALEQNSFNLTVRLNYNITPNLTVQYYGSPFITQVQYDDFKYIVDPRARLDDRFERYGEAVTFDAENDSYNLNTPDCIDCSFANPDISFIQFRSNLVARWEYIPGSELFLVWSQGTTNTSGDPSAAIFPTLNEELFQERGQNIFLIKWTYRFLL